MMAEGIIFQHGLMEDVGLWRPHPSGAPAPSLNRRALWGHDDGAVVRVWRGVVCFPLFCFVLFCFVLFCFVLFCFVLLGRDGGEDVISFCT